MMPLGRETKNVAILVAAQALFMTSATMLVILNGLIGFSLAENKALATVPVSAVVIAAAATIIPASLFMKRYGRRMGFVVGALCGATGAATAAAAIVMQSFPLFIFGAFQIGIYGGVAQYFRFAAADVASPDFKSKAISLVVAGGVVAAFVGPELVMSSSDLVAPNRYLGSYLIVVALAFAAAALLLLFDSSRPPLADHEKPGRPLTQIMRQPAFAVAALVGMVGYGVTVLMMTATPLAMAAYGHSLDRTAFVIQWHTLAMFAPAFVTGNLIKWFGALNVMLVGTVVLGICVVAALGGVSVSRFWLGLAALGLGWNFTFIGASALLTEAYLPVERAKVQAANDFLVFGSAAAASLLSGALLSYFDWVVVNYFAIPFLLVAGATTLWLSMSRRMAARRALN